MIMYNRPIQFALAALIVTGLLMTACKKEEKSPLTIPSTYDASAYTTNTTTQYAVRGQLDTFVNEAKKGRTAGVITDAEIDQLLVLLNAPYDGTPTSYTFATDPVNQLPKLTQVIQQLKTEYGFSDQEILDFKENWVAVQGR